MYLTQQEKKEIESEISDLRNKIIEAFEKEQNNLGWVYSGQCSALENIISKAIVLPVYDSLGKAMQDKNLTNPNGVIILNK